MPVKPGDNFSVKKHFKDMWDTFWLISVNAYGYSLAINMAVKHFIDKTTDVRAVIEYAKNNPDFKRRLKEGLEGL